MKEKLKKALRNPWVIGVGTIIIAQIIFSIFNFNLIKGVIIFFINLSRWIGKFFTLPVTLQVWAIILLILTLPVIIFILVLLTPKKKETGPSPYEYKKDTFDGMVWRWKWKYSEYEKRNHVDKLTPYCPKCDCQLRIHGGGHLSCPNCRFEEFDFSKSAVDLEMLILHRIRQKYFPDQE